MKGTGDIRVGVVGAGMVADWHLQRLAGMPVTLIGVHSRTFHSARRLCNRYGVRLFESFEEMLAAVDVIDVCTPTPAHKEYVLAAAAAGKAVICEKPLAGSLGDATEMIEACRRAGVPLCVGHVVRFFPQYQAAKRLIEGGSIGSPGVFRATRGRSFPRPHGGTWYSDPELSGGVILDLAIHDIDVGMWWLGPIKRVFARGLTLQGQPQRDHALLTLRFESGAIGHIEASWSMPEGRFYNSFEVAGSGGIAEWDGLARGALEVHLGQAGEGGEAVPEGGMLLDDADDPYRTELDHFIDHIANGTQLLVGADEGREALRVALAALESLRTGEPVEIAGAEGGNR